MDTSVESASSIEVVLKVAERCNINCSYCYVFNKGNTNYQSKPPYMSRDVLKKAAQFVNNGARDLGATKVVIVFHGGEPLMLGKRDFSWCAQHLREVVTHPSELVLAVQTNAMLVDAEWIEIFSANNIAVGVSIDGPRAIHDTERVDFKNRGTYERTIKGLRILQGAAESGQIYDPGIICAVQPLANGAETYSHFVRQLKVKDMSFHLPMDTHDTFLGDPDGYGKFLCDAFDEWLRDGDSSVHVRMFAQFVGYLQGRYTRTALSKSAVNLQHVTIESDGAIDIDELKPIPLGFPALNIHTHSLVEYANSAMPKFYKEVHGSLSDQCAECVWKNYCRGGLVHGVQVNRWSKKKGFDNVSVLCSAWRQFYSHATQRMLAAGFDENDIAEALDGDQHSYSRAAELKSRWPLQCGS